MQLFLWLYQSQTLMILLGMDFWQEPNLGWPGKLGSGCSLCVRVLSDWFRCLLRILTMSKEALSSETFGVLVFALWSGGWINWGPEFLCPPSALVFVWIFLNLFLSSDFSKLLCHCDGHLIKVSVVIGSCPPLVSWRMVNVAVIVIWFIFSMFSC